MSQGVKVFPAVAAAALSCSLTGCFSKKNEAVAETTAPPPAAYPSGAGDSAYSGGSYSPGSSYGSSEPTTYQQQQQSSYQQAPVEPAPFEARNDETLVSYLIQPGDNLSNIAKKHGTTVARIMSANGMTSDTIYAGKTLQIPSTISNQVSNGSVVSSGGQPRQIPSINPVVPSSTSYERSNTTGGNYVGPADEPGMPVAPAGTPNAYQGTNTPPTIPPNGNGYSGFGGASINFSD